MDFLAHLELPACLVYLILWAIGVFTSMAFIEERVGPVKGAWGLVETWMLFLIYSFIPPVLVFMLDYTGSLHDTSVLVAVLAGLSYKVILSGQSTTFQTPGEVASYWTPFAKWTDGVFERINKYVVASGEAFEGQVLANIHRGGQQVQDALAKLASERTTQPEQLENDVKEFEARKAEPREVSRLYLAHARSKNWSWAAYRRDIITFGQLFRLAFEGRGLWKLTVPMLLVGLTAAFATPWKTLSGGKPLYYALAPNLQEEGIRISWYYGWRLTKPHATPRDRRAAADYFEEKAQSEQAQTKAGEPMPRAIGALANLTDLFRKNDDLPEDSVESIVGVFVRHGAISPAASCDAAYSLVPALASASKPVREHVQATLSDLGDNISIDKAVPARVWTPTENDTEAQLQKEIAAWNGSLQTTCKGLPIKS